MLKATLISAQTFTKNILLWVRGPNSSQLYRHLCIVSVCAAGVFALFGMQAWYEGSWQPKIRQGLSRHVAEMSASMLPIPFVFYFWVRLMEKRRPFTTAYSPLFAILSISCFTGMYVMTRDWNMTKKVFLLGVITSFFVMIPVKEAVPLLLRNPRVTLVAIIGGMAAYNYYWLMRDLWYYMCGWTTTTVYYMLQFLSYDAVAYVHGRKETSFVILSKYFGIIVNPGCNGLEGIFLFNFMLSVMFLVDWEFFKKRSIILIYAIGAVYMFFVNALRITAFFSVGYWASQPNMPGWVKSMRGTTVELFHSYVGWAFYLIAFALFATWLYDSTAKKLRKAQPRMA